MIPPQSHRIHWRSPPPCSRQVHRISSSPPPRRPRRRRCSPCSRPRPPKPSLDSSSYRRRRMTSSSRRRRRLVYPYTESARAYDMVALKYWGATTTTNFPVSNYEKSRRSWRR